MKLSSIGASFLLLIMSCAIEKPMPMVSKSNPIAPPVQINQLSDFAQSFLSSINAIRKKGCTCGKIYMPPAEPVTWNNQLELSATRHAQDMAYYKYFSHTGRNGKAPKQRILDAGYVISGFQSYAVGENIAQGQRSIQQVMNEWILSEGHCKNLMNTQYKEVGVAVNNFYWVQDFGGRKPFANSAKK